MKKTFLIVLIICSCLTSWAQEKSNKKIKVYQTWIRLNNNPGTVKGILYEIGDSSVFVTESLNNKSLHEYRFNDIELLKVRRQKSVIRGTIAGGIFGFGGGLITASAFAGDFGYLESIVAATLGITYGIIGAGAGALIGSVKDRFPMRNSFENLKKYRRSLQDYSYINEKRTAGDPFEHRGYMSFSMGWAFAQGEFASIIPVENYVGMKRQGFSTISTLGYRFNETIGVAFVMRTDQYNLEEQSQVPSFWNFDTFAIGPVISFPISKKIRFDLNPSIGSSSAYLLIENKEVYTGRGIGLQGTGTLVYNVSKRWTVSSSVGYISAKQHFKQGENGKASIVDLEFGMAYKFGKRSL
jgi:hypothetical protein